MQSYAQEKPVQCWTYKKPTVASALGVVLTVQVSGAKVRATTDTGQRSHEHSVLELDGAQFQRGG
jgi:hypothetical protein